MTRSQIRAFVDSSSVDHEAFFRNLADAKLQK
jgi:hypothetical protein